MKNQFVKIPIATMDGIFLAHYSGQGLAGLDFPKLGAARRANIVDRPPGPPQRGVPANILRWHRATTDALKKLLAGRGAKKLPPLDWSGKTEFQQSVWRAMLKLSAGQTKSYGKIAVAIGKPKAVRAVGGACGANPIPVLVPCHRVLAAHGRIGGFGGGLEWKRSLLAREGILMRNKIEDKVVGEWGKAADDLKFKFTAPFMAKSPNGASVECLGLVHRFGSHIGTLLSVRVGPSADMNYPRLSEGYSEVCLGYQHYNRKKWIEMLCDWGFWGPPSEWPKWFSPGPVCHLQYVNGIVSPSTG